MPRIGTLQAAIILHNTLLSGIMKAPMVFFDSTPVGRILGRFAKDIEEVDNSFPFNVSDGVYCFFEVTKTCVYILINHLTPLTYCT